MFCRLDSTFRRELRFLDDYLFDQNLIHCGHSREQLSNSVNSADRAAENLNSANNAAKDFK
jgi:hypothetical protein